METGILKLNRTEIKYSLLKDKDNNWMQFWYSIVPERSELITEQIKTIEQAESELFKYFKIKNDTAATKRFFSSDLINHYNEIINYKNRQNTDFYISLTEQPPVSGVKVVLLAMCLSNIIAKHREDNCFYFDTTTGIRHFFTEHLLDSDADEHSDSEKQTERIFDLLKKKLLDFGTTIEESVIRTWIYAPHIDADYPGIVKARKQYFDSINLTKYTHYIASTGIQGGAGSCFARVFMDAYAIIGIPKNNIRYIQAPEYLSPTHTYGVTFERATAVVMGNTNFLFISGTASIDKEGEIVSPGNVVKQTERTLQNISALLAAADFSKKDLSSFIVYIRDPADYSFVKPIVNQYMENLPTVYVKAQVCRPGWLIEIEATAAKVVN